MKTTDFAAIEIIWL